MRTSAHYYCGGGEGGGGITMFSRHDMCTHIVPTFGLQPIQLTHTHNPIRREHLMNQCRLLASHVPCLELLTVKPRTMHTLPAKENPYLRGSAHTGQPWSGLTTTQSF